MSDVCVLKQNAQGRRRMHRFYQYKMRDRPGRSNCSFWFLTIFTAHFISYVQADGCSVNGGTFNATCSLDSNPDYSTDIAVNQSIIWKIRPQSISFNHYLMTSEDGEDLVVRGIVKWKVILKNWTPDENVIEGFRVTIGEPDKNGTEETVYYLSISQPFDVFAANSENFQMRLEFDNVLSFGKQYEAKVSLLPLGKQAAASSFLSVGKKSTDGSCSDVKSLVSYWAPQVYVDIKEVSSSIKVMWEPAPSFLCIATYAVELHRTNLPTFNSELVQTSFVKIHNGQKMIYHDFSNLLRNETYFVKVRASGSSTGNNACNNNHCLSVRSTKFILPSKPIKQAPEAMILLNFTSTYTENQYYTPFILTIIGIVFVFLMMVFAFCIVMRRYKPNIKRRLFMKTNQYLPGSPKQVYKILLVCSDAVDEEAARLKTVTNALRQSDHHVVCDKFEEHSKLAEENLLHWMYKNVSVADKIVILHSTQISAPLSLYSIVSAIVPSHDRRIIHINLSSEVLHKISAEIEYVLPRDQVLLEQAFDIVLADFKEESMQDEQPCTIEPLKFEVVSENEEEAVKSHTVDSGVASLSCASIESNDEAFNFTETQSQELKMELKEIEEIPLLRQAIAV